jgi:hypothetical protein
MAFIVTEVEMQSISWMRAWTISQDDVVAADVTITPDPPVHANPNLPVVICMTPLDNNGAATSFVLKEPIPPVAGGFTLHYFGGNPSANPQVLVTMLIGPAVRLAHP